MSAARRLPSLSILLDYGVWCHSILSRSLHRRTVFLFSTSPVRSPIARSHALLSLSSWLQTALILSLSKVIRPSSLCNFWTMSSTSSYCKSADAFGEPGGNCGTGVGGSVGGPNPGSENNLRLFPLTIGHRIPLPPLSCSLSLCLPLASLRGRLHSRAESERE